MRTLRYLDLSGYGFSGKSAVTDLMREFHGYCVSHYQFEFNLIRIQGGIRDLETALVDDWSPIRSDAALRRFRRLVQRLALTTSWLRPATWLTSLGANYESRFKNQFCRISEQYVDQLTEAKWNSAWPYVAADLSGLELFWRRIRRKLGSRTADEVEYRLAAPENFLAITREYLNQLLNAYSEEQDHTVVMNNSFEPFNPGRALRYFHDARCIIVDRDPRDIYVEQQTQEEYVADDARAGKGSQCRWMPGDPEVFVRRFRLQRERVRRAGEEGNRVLRLRFEELVCRYDETLARICNFLGEPRSAHQTPRRYYRPELSARNVGRWKAYSHQARIAYIERELSDYCWRQEPPQS